MMDELEELADKGEGVNFIPCLKWVTKGVSKAQPEKIKLTKEELAKVISKTKTSLDEIENESDNDSENEQKESEADKLEDDSEQIDSGERDIEKIYNMDAYDDESDNDETDFGNLVAFADPKDDPYLVDPNKDDDESDIEDNIIKADDNLLLVGHVEGNAAILEVYVYNDNEDALYVHHDILLPSYPMAMEWLNFDPGEATKGNFVAIGTMQPTIDIWDLDIVDGLEPAFTLGQKGSKKKKLKRIGHKDAVLSLAWNKNANHLLASGSVDQTVLLWDLREGKPGRTLSGHNEKIQSLQWHPMEPQVLLTGCCDKKARVYDCNQESFKAWTANGEVEKVLWDHFNPFNFYVATDTGYVHLVDARQDKKFLWTLSAHSEGINGMSLSSQCPGLLVTGSSDKTMKVWDVSGASPSCLEERDAKIGMVHCLEGCPDAPFVFAFGGDTPSHNMHVMDVRESSAVSNRFNGDRAPEDMENQSGEASEQACQGEEATRALEQLSVNGSSSGGAAGKYKKKPKKGKKKAKF